VCPDDGESGVRRLYLEFPNGNTLLLDDDKVVLEAGDTTLTIKNSGDVELKSNAKLLIETQGNTDIKAQGNIALEAGGSLSLKAQTTAQLEGGASTTVKGPTISIAGNVSFAPG